MTVPLVFLLAACTTGAGSTPAPPSGSGSPSPSPSAAVEGIEHPSGATDVILRVEVGGGFVPMAFAMTQAPSFTLYGDGTVIVRDESQPFPQPAADGTTALLPFHIGKMSEIDVEDLLRYALTDGGLAVARARYDEGMIADAPSTWFDIDAGGIQKRVQINALSESDPSQPDTPDRQIRAAFYSLAERLRTLATNIAATTPVWQPDRWRGTLVEGGGFGGAPRAWPWTDLELADLAPTDPGSSFLRHELTKEQVAALGLSDLGGGVQGISLKGSDGKVYELALRPVFPGETS